MCINWLVKFLKQTNSTLPKQAEVQNMISVNKNDEITEIPAGWWKGIVIQVHVLINNTYLVTAYIFSGQQMGYMSLDMNRTVQVHETSTCTLIHTESHQSLQQIYSY